LDGYISGYILNEIEKMKEQKRISKPVLPA